jgi:transposase
MEEARTWRLASMRAPTGLEPAWVDCGRDLAAWLGLVPRQFTTGGKPKLLGISKRGNRYLRKQLIH